MTPGYEYKKFAVLFVDDEEQARKYFRMAFEQDFQVLTAGGVEEAWQLVNRAEPPVGVVITDQRMPDRVGTDLLAQVRRGHPEIVRMLTTAYADVDAAVEAVNSGAIFKYLMKPWDVRELRITLRHSMEYFLLRRERDLLLREKLSSLQQLLVADRVRSLAILAEGLSTQVRNTMIALSAYVQLARDEFGAAAKSSAYAERYLRNLQWETEDANRHLLRVVQSVAGATLEAHYEFNDQALLSEIVEAAWSQAMAFAASDAVTVALAWDIKPEFKKLGCSQSMLRRMFANLFRSILAPEHAGGGSADPVRVIAQETAQVWGEESIVVDVVRAGFDWGDASLSSLFLPVLALGDAEDTPDLLAAFFIAHHHGGTIALQRRHPAGNGFRVTLPFCPERVCRPALDDDATERLFTQLPSWDALEREA
jgi:two-component system, probable response regulator PhcQ